MRIAPGHTRGGRALAICLVLFSCSEQDGPAVRAADALGPSRDEFTRMKTEHIVPSEFLPEGILVKPGVFDPGEAEEYVLPLMRDNARRFQGKDVLEIGTGSGAISLYAAKLGARRVVATDIDPVALECAQENAERMGLADLLETRLVTPDDLSAYAVVRPDERFDVILSNPPYSLDLDAEANTPEVDTGDLGLSIIQGLPEHLNPDGVVLLLYNSLFYHHVMVKYAKREGYVVRNHNPSMLTVWEAQTLFNAYLDRFLEHEGIDSDGMEFDYATDRYLYRIRVSSDTKPLFPGNSARRYPGMLILERQ